ncbi:virion core peptidase [Flamingopox virus FGPVKD09]|uniref:Virion core peptidase n=1 Tax=Flamingopox virus FGPVKD09 TaxID=2059380 RepID=A0A2H4X293_9POXV|nr:virion core peptidase [Flamingopox virus FGPVKD09]AUD40186.1 virion core peptidase [Flamingopox virus FGPVKD09]
MDKYTELVINKIPELGFVNLLSHIYQTVGLCSSIDISKFKTNCNGYVVERFDKSETAGKVSCVPISILIELVERGMLSKPDNSKSQLEVKTDLVNELMSKNNGFEDIMTIPTSIPMKYFFKPVLKEKVSKAIDFSVMDIKGDDVSRMGIRYGENDKVVKIKIAPERDAWMTNTSIHQFIIPMCYGTEVAYIGQFNFNFMNRHAIYEKAFVFNKNTEVFKLKERIRDNRSSRFIMFGFCYLHHWKCAIYDKNRDFICFYDSGGNNPNEFNHYRNFFFYSNSDGLNRNSYLSSLANENADIDTLFNFFIDNYDVTAGCINVEVNQLMESECGMFTCLFMAVCCLNPPKGFKGIRKIYTYFKFLADKKVTMLKSILFNVGKMDFTIKDVDGEGMEQYKKMEKWCANTINILANKITSRVEDIIN